jgi:F-type H+-transporting ATPase subunit epsilon
MAKITVEIVTPEKRVLSVQADEAIIPGYRGLFGVRPGHTPFLSLVEDGTLTLKDGASQQLLHIEGGFVEVGNDKVLVLANNAYPVTAIDVNDAKRKMDEAQKKLAGMSTEDSRFHIESAAVKREAARIASAARR